MRDQDDDTSRRVRRAVNGDQESVGWVVERFSGLLLAQARFRLGGRLCAIYDPADVVHDVWQAVLPRLAGLTAKRGRYSAALRAYLTRAVLLRVRDLIEKHLAGERREVPIESASGCDDDRDAAAPPAACPGHATGFSSARSGTAYLV